jgi:hypothetical protein
LRSKLGGRLLGRFAFDHSSIQAPGTALSPPQAMRDTIAAATL